MQSGTKLVVLLTCLAVALGLYSWWNRYESTHRAIKFWGPGVVELLVEPSRVEVTELKNSSGELPDPESFAEGRDISEIRGMVHFRHALTTDANYQWDAEPPQPHHWQWAFRFARGNDEVWVLFADDFATLGRYHEASSTVAAVSCLPMAATLQEYFAKLGIDEKEDADSTASNEVAGDRPDSKAAE